MKMFRSAPRLARSIPGLEACQHSLIDEVGLRICTFSSWFHGRCKKLLFLSRGHSVESGTWEGDSAGAFSMVTCRAGQSPPSSQHTAVPCFQVALVKKLAHCGLQTGNALLQCMGDKHRTVPRRRSQPSHPHNVSQRKCIHCGSLRVAFCVLLGDFDEGNFCLVWPEQAPALDTRSL